ncbi:NucA/NucB deoxyribonuclease domain-containing protein [Streptomyces sp. 4.24]|uniref:NucA/NucB deoxyribonuclease domain-containing protein n=1 Tax=Streptomyces tritrimontium TaxID=3406573 RepID=UPI003BB58B39
MKFRVAVTTAVGLAAVLGALTAPASSAADQSSGTTVWSRSSEAGQLAEVGSKYTGSLEGLTKNSSPSDAPLRPAQTSPEEEDRKAKENGDTYVVDSSADTLPAPLNSPAAGPGPIPDWAGCNGRSEGHRPQGQVINHFEFCRWGYNIATKLDGKGRVEGQVRFKETEVGWGSNSGRGARINVKTTELKSTGIFASGATMSLQPTTSGWPALKGCKVENFGTGTHSKPVSNWNNAYVFYDLSSPIGDPNRIDKISLCVFQSNYKVSGPRGATPWSDGNDGGLRMDSAAYLNPYGKQGAIFDRVTPFLAYDYKNADVKAVAEHINTAFTKPNSTRPLPAAGQKKLIPGNYFANGTVVHRNFPGFNAASKKISTANRTAKDKACKPLTKPNPTDQCDEFPFASTKEGAGRGDGNFSVRYVPQPDNSKAGSALSKWYGQDRILDGDKYGVVIKNAPAAP